MTFAQLTGKQIPRVIQVRLWACYHVHVLCVSARFENKKHIFKLLVRSIDQEQTLPTHRSLGINQSSFKYSFYLQHQKANLAKD
uniref:Uncharacterized protein n=1 Tax=Rhizophora mucronata TaxID=61149 RepID=A0A2P2QRH2_RHIMU